MSAWPVTLPQKQFAGASIQDDESRLISQMDSGPASVRSRFNAITKTVSTNIIVTGTQLDTFNTFFRTTIVHGSMSFTWTDPATGSTATFRFKTKPKWTCIKPSSVVASRLWQAGLDLEILP